LKAGAQVTLERPTSDSQEASTLHAHIGSAIHYLKIAGIIILNRANYGFYVVTHPKDWANCIFHDHLPLRESDA
jgi:hypothetical protein